MTEDIVTLHREAMAKADEADALRRLGAPRKDVVSVLRDATDLESRAAALAFEEVDKAVLLRSAATLAHEAGDLRRAEKLAATALAGEPPQEIAEELRAVLDQCSFERHLHVRGRALGEDEFQMSLAGDDVGYGMTRSDRLTKRIEDMQKLLYRTAERQTRAPFREEGRPTKKVRDSLEIYVSVPRAASMAVSFRLVRPSDQEQMFPDVTPAKTMHEVLRCIELLNEDRDEELRSRFDSGPDQEAYLKNFLALARAIAPDGDAVNLVGLTTTAADGVRQIAFQRAAKTIAIRTARPVDDETPPISVRGLLRHADSRKKRSSMITVVSAEGSETTIRVHPGMMADIVRPLWDSEVIVSARQRGGVVWLEDIRAADG